MLGSDGYTKKSRTPRGKAGETSEAAGGRAGAGKGRESDRSRAREGSREDWHSPCGCQAENRQARKEGQAKIAAQGEEAGEKEAASRGSLIAAAIDDSLIEEARRIGHHKTKKDAVTTSDTDVRRYAKLMPVQLH